MGWHSLCPGDGAPGTSGEPSAWGPADQNQGSPGSIRATPFILPQLLQVLMGASAFSPRHLGGPSCSL